MWREVTVKFYWIGSFLGILAQEKESYWKCCPKIKKVNIKGILKPTPLLTHAKVLDYQF